MKLNRFMFNTIAVALILTGVGLLLPHQARAQNPPECFYNACSVGPICDLGQQYYSPGDFIYNQELSFPVGGLKIIPQPYYEEYKDFNCQADECLADVSDTTYCVSQIDDEIPAIRLCTAITLPYCDIRDCQRALSSSPYCEVGARRYCNSPALPPGWYQCYANRWGFPNPPITGDSGSCNSEPPHPVMGCNDGTVGVPGSGTWVNLPERPDDQSRCEEMLVELTAAMTPGYVKTYTPYLRDIWQNTVRGMEAVFTPFRTEIGKEIYDWPGESAINYEFAPYSGEGFANAGNPPQIHPGNDARIYFRYLGYIHCAKENLLQKLSSVFHDPPYVYYDARCDVELW